MSDENAEHSWENLTMSWMFWKHLGAQYCDVLHG